jgi:mRNA deadenylase 3'-5' endonuclease subunit Ccr4
MALDEEYDSSLGMAIKWKKRAEALERELSRLKSQ